MGSHCILWQAGNNDTRVTGPRPLRSRRQRHMDQSRGKDCMPLDPICTKPFSAALPHGTKQWQAVSRWRVWTFSHLPGSEAAHTVVGWGIRRTISSPSQAPQPPCYISLPTSEAATSCILMVSNGMPGVVFPGSSVTSLDADYLSGLGFASNLGDSRVGKASEQHSLLALQEAP
jgi:hypothetical protein